jgi:hypothetical protein
MAQSSDARRMHVHPPIPPEEVIHRARKRYLSSLRQFLVFFVIFIITVIYCVIVGSNAFGVQSYSLMSRHGGAGGFQPVMLPLIIGGLGAIFQFPDLRKAWREYREALKNHGLPHFEHHQ